ncbi:MAG: hypothetical protein ABIO55_07375 [Ginsengibacter sp.]
MKTNSAQQEILLVTGTSFSSRQFCENSDETNDEEFTEKEKLVIACWNGLLPEMLPEIFSESSVNKKLYLWEIRETSSFLELDLGEIQAAFEKQFSIDPYSFLPLQIFS